MCQLAQILSMEVYDQQFFISGSIIFLILLHSSDLGLSIAVCNVDAKSGSLTILMNFLLSFTSTFNFICNSRISRMSFLLIIQQKHQPLILSTSVIIKDQVFFNDFGTVALPITSLDNPNGNKYGNAIDNN